MFSIIFLDKLTIFQLTGQNSWSVVFLFLSCSEIWSVVGCRKPFNSPTLSRGTSDHRIIRFRSVGMTTKSSEPLRWSRNCGTSRCCRDWERHLCYVSRKLHVIHTPSHTASIRVYIYIHIYIHTYCTYIRTHTYICMYVYVYVSMYVCKSVCVKVDV